MSTAIDGIETWPTEIEVVSMWVTGIDSEAPVAVVIIEWAIEIVGCAIGSVLPIEQNIA